MRDDSAFNAKNLSRLESELAAVMRQYQRAFAAGDHPALAVETTAICDRVRWLLYHHLDLRVGMQSDDWVWLDGQFDCRIERMGALDLRATGRLECSLPEWRRRWNEPFQAQIVHLPTAASLDIYTVYLGTRATFLNVSHVRQLLESGDVVSPHAPIHQDDWAFVFRMGDRS